MEKEIFNLYYNCCSIELKVAGLSSLGSGIIYITQPSCKYNYVITAKHIFQENSVLNPDYNTFSDIKIGYFYKKNQLKETIIQQKDIKNNFLYFSSDFAIIKIEKIWMPNAKRFILKSIADLDNRTTCIITGFPKICRNERQSLEAELEDKDYNNLKVLNKVQDIENLRGMSGAGVSIYNNPFVIGVVSEYPLENFELNIIKIDCPNWNDINALLREKHWEELLVEENSNHQKISDNKELINISEVWIQGVPLNLNEARNKLSFDLRDDWFFDPLSYIDMANNDFILDYFCKKDNRDKYENNKMETAYIPKESFVLRKALIGSYIDRLIYTAIVDKLGPLMDENLNSFVFSARYNFDKNYPGLIVSGVEQWIKMNYLIKGWIEECIKDNEKTIVKVDLLNYYDTINKKTLIRLLKEITIKEEDKRATRLLDSFLNKIGSAEDVNGLPQNNDASSILATFYISHIDEYMILNSSNYCRFMDDIYFVCDNKNKARILLQSLEKELRKINLSLNSQKVKFFTNEEELKELGNQLYSFDYQFQQSETFLNSSSKTKKLNAFTIITDIFIDKNNESEINKRKIKFCLNIFSKQNLQLNPRKQDFFNRFNDFVCEFQIDQPYLTPLVCRILASLKESDRTNYINSIAHILTDNRCVYEWQTYNLWLLLAYLKYDTKELKKYVSEALEKGDNTKQIEIGAMMIYMTSITPQYARIILHKLRNGQITGNFLIRCALIACRSLSEESIDEEIIKRLPKNLQTCHKYLHKNREKDLVFFSNIASNISLNNNIEIYSGL